MAGKERGSPEIIPDEVFWDGHFLKDNCPIDKFSKLIYYTPLVGQIYALSLFADKKRDDVQLARAASLALEEIETFLEKGVPNGTEIPQNTPFVLSSQRVGTIVRFHADFALGRDKRESDLFYGIIMQIPEVDVGLADKIIAYKEDELRSDNSGGIVYYTLSQSEYKIGDIVHERRFRHSLLYRITSLEICRPGTIIRRGPNDTTRKRLPELKPAY